MTVLTRSPRAPPKAGGNAGEVRHILCGMEKCGMDKPVFTDPSVKTKFGYYMEEENKIT